MLPGPTDSWRSYEPTLDRLTGPLHGIAVSLRGHGDSDKPVSGYSVPDFATDVVQLLDALAIGRAVLAAHSGACLIARRVALDHPDRVAGLVLEASPTTLVGDASLEAFVTSVVAALEDPIDPDFVRAWIGDTSSDDTASRPETDRLVAEVLKVPAHVWRQTLGSLLNYDDTSELARLAAPTLLVWGDADQLVTEAAQGALVEAIPNARLTVYPGAGHAPRLDEPHRFASDVASFTLDSMS
jgi:pimeloyl-ACP methyl ester carboxylesterase